MLAVEAVQVVDENVDQDQAVILQISFMNSNIFEILTISLSTSKYLKNLEYFLSKYLSNLNGCPQAEPPDAYFLKC